MDIARMCLNPHMLNSRKYYITLKYNADFLIKITHASKITFLGGDLHFITLLLQDHKLATILQNAKPIQK